MSVNAAKEHFSIKRMDQILPSKDRLIAIDPGGSTGVATRSDNMYFTFTFTYPDDVFQMLIDGTWDAVIYEDFNTGGNISKDGQHTLKVIGGILALCWQKGLKPYRQMPQERMAFLTRATDILKGFSGPHTMHEKDALAHLLRWEYNYGTAGSIQNTSL